MLSAPFFSARRFVSSAPRGLFFAALLTTLLSTAFFSPAAHGQDGENAPEPLLHKYGAKSPEAAEIEKYGTIPVGMYTGTANISIPLFTVQSGDLSLPISLKYATTGIRVSQRATWVGLGWSLSAGGAVTRQMKGRPDEDGLLRSSDRQNFQDYIGGNMAVSRYGFGGDSTDPNTGKYYTDFYLYRVSTGFWDAQPDRYSASAPGLSTSFVFGEAATRLKYDDHQLSSLDSSEIILIPYGPTKIEKGPGGWQATSAAGTQYRFDDVEQTTTQLLTPSSSSTPNYLSDISYVSAWHLSSIINPAGTDSISIDYNTLPGTWDTSISETVSRDIDQEGSIATCSSVNSRSASKSLNVSERVLPSIIESKKHRVTFYRDGQRLSKIEVHHASTGVLLRTIDFTYSTFATTDGSAGRLRLDAVTIHDGTNTESKEFSFSYNNEPLPPRQSHAKDHWGFYNGALSNGEGIADCGNSVNAPCLVPDQEVNGTVYPGADREPNAATMTAGMLTGVSYPTGGSTQLHYEPNQFTNVVPAYDTFSHTAVASHRMDQTPTGVVENRTSFSVTEDRTTTVRPVVNSALDGSASGCYYPASGAPEVLLVDASGATIRRWVHDALDLGQEHEVYLNSGTYELIARAWCGSSSIDVSWQEQNGTEVVSSIGSGIRIDRVEKQASDTSPTTVTDYTYVDENGLSTGKPFGKEIDYSRISESYSTVDMEANRCYVKSFSSSSALSSLTSMGGLVSYDQVTAEQEDGSKTTHYFKQGTFQAPSQWPGATPSDYTFNGGTELKTRSRSATDDTISLSESEYLFAAPSQKPSAIRGINTMVDVNYTLYQGPNFPGKPYVKYIAQENRIATGWVRPTLQKTETYDADGQRVSQTVQYSYESDPLHFQPESVTRTATDAPTRIDSTTFAFETLQGQMGPSGTHQLAAPHVQLTLDASGTVLKGQETTYQFVSHGNGAWFPKEQYVIVGSDGTRERVKTINDYNRFGKPTQITDALGQTVTLTYGGSGAPGGSTDAYGDAYLTGVSMGGFSSSFTWNQKGQLATRTNSSGVSASFFYDAFGRLASTRNDAGDEVAAYEYYYAGPDGSPATSPNYVRTTARGGSSPDQVSISFADGLGRVIQSQVQAGDSSIVSAKTLDTMGRPSHAYRPYTADTDQAFDPTGYQTRPASVTTYLADGTGRTDTVNPPGNAANDIIKSEYGIESIPASSTTFHGLSGTFQYTKTTDERGNTTKTYIDAREQKVAVVADSAGVRAVTRFEYDAAGNLVTVTKPEGDTVSYRYDLRGQLIERSSPDAGTTRMRYDVAGKLRFSQNEKQRANGTALETGYDVYGRPIYTGIRNLSGTSFDALDTEMNTPLATSAWVSATAYDDFPASTDEPFSMVPPPSGEDATNANGNLVAQLRKSDGIWRGEYFVYDSEGRVSTKYIRVQASEGSPGADPALNANISYTYDRQSRITKRTVTTGNGDAVSTWYNYNDRGQLLAVYASTQADATRPNEPDVSYTYTADGQIKTIDFMGMDPIVRQYDPNRGWLKSIDSPYFGADYTYLYDGNIHTAGFTQPGFTDGPSTYEYEFAYDGLDRLTGADFGRNGTGGDYDLAVNYDRNGNITSLQRGSQPGISGLRDDLSYTYDSNRTNRLIRVEDRSSSGLGVGTGDFTYDAVGNMHTAQGAPYTVSAMTYDDRNLPTSMTANGATYTYRYTSSGQRYWTDGGADGASYYVLDGATTLGVLDDAGGLQYWNLVTPSGRVIGRLEP